MKAITMLGVVALMLAALVLGTACAGKNGVGIESIEDNGNGTFTIYLTDGSSFTSSDLTGPQGAKGDKGDQGLQGIQGPAGEMPDLEWHYVASFTGSEDQVTAPFYVPTDDFRLAIYAYAVADGGHVYFQVKPQGGSVAVEIVDLDVPSYGRSDIEYVGEGKGYYYLDVIAWGLTEYTVFISALY